MVAHVPDRCTVCDASIPPGRERCPGCGKVFGEANRCGSCHGIAAVREVSPGRYVCTACGAPRSREPGTAIDSDFADELASQATRSRWASYLLWPFAAGTTVFGAATLALGGAFASGGFLTASYVVGGAFLVFGLPLVLAARGLGRKARRLSEEALDAKLVLSAARHHGTLTAETAARELTRTAAEVDRRLTDLAKRGRLGLDVDDEGVLRYRVAEARGDEEPDPDAIARASLKDHAAPRD